MKYILFIILTLSNIIILQAGVWKVVDDEPYGVVGTTNSHIACADTNNCITVSYYNYDRLRDRITTDGGKTWFTTYYDRDPTWEEYLEQYWHYPNGVQYPDTNLIVITCEDGNVWISRDKGKQWTITEFDTFAVRASFCDSKHGAITSWDNLYLTSDGGNNWGIINFKYIDSIYHLGGKVYVLDSATIFLFIGMNEFNARFHRTYNWGLTWETFDILINPHDLFFFNKTEGYCVSGPKVNTNVRKDQIYYTNDGGETWQKKIDTINNFPTGADGIRKIRFADEKNGVVIGPWNKMYRTSDGGKTWVQDTSHYNQLYKPRLMFDYLDDIAYPSQNIVFAVGKDGTTCKFEETTMDVKEWKRNNESTIEIFPNPVLTGEKLNLKIFLENNAHIKIEFINSLGQRVGDIFETYLKDGESTLQYEFDNSQSSGLYWLRVTIENGVQIVKPLLIIQ